MNFRTTAFLFGLLFGLLWLFGLMLALKPGYSDLGYLFPGLSDTTEADIDAVEIERKTDAGRERYVLTKTDAGWKLKLPALESPVRADRSKVEKIVGEVKDARKDEEAADVFNDPGRFGLTNPKEKVTLKGKGKEWELSVGNESPDGNYLYVMSSERPGKVMAVRKASVPAVLLKSANDLRDRKLLDVTAGSADAVALRGKKDGKAEEVSLKKTREGDWVFVAPPYGLANAGGGAFGLPGETKDKEPAGVGGLLADIGKLNVESDEDFMAADKGMATYGLEDGKEALRIDVAHAEGFGAERKTVKDALLISTKFGPIYYARLAGDNTVVRLKAEKVEPLFAVFTNPATLRSTDLAKLDPHAPDAVDIRQGKGLKEVVKLRRPEPTRWDLLVDKEPVRKANAQSIEGEKGLLESLQGKKQVKKFIDFKETDPAKRKAEEEKKDAELGLTAATAAAQVLVYVKGLEKPAAPEKDKGKADEKKELELKKDARPALTLTFGKSEGGQVYVKREEGGTVSRVAVPADLLDKVIPAQGWLAFLDPSLSPFTAEDATKVKLVRADGTFEADKDAKKNEWTLAVAGEKGSKKADAQQVESVLHRLAALTVKKWVKRTTDKKELETFGLLKPTLTAEVTVKKKDDAKPTTTTYEFGKESETDKPAVYARQAGSDLVFLAQEADYKQLQTAELRDRTIYDFDPAKVKKVELTVRAAVTLKPVFERGPSPGTWVDKSGQYEDRLDNQKVQDFVLVLSRLRTERYVAFKAPTPDQKLGEKEAALIVRLTMEDGKTTHTLTLGAKDKEGDYYATADTHPNTVFLVSRAQFDPVMVPGYFGKK